jgi:hypothetical protein
VKIGAMYSHFNGHEWLLVHQRKSWSEIVSIIESIDANRHRTKVSKEKGMKGRKLFAPKQLNKVLHAAFAQSGWCESRTSYWVTDDYNLIRATMHLSSADQKSAIEGSGRRPIFSYNQTDFTKNRIAVEVQLGKYSFIAYDLIC